MQDPRLLAKVLESAADAIYSDDGTLVTSWNAGAEELFGWTVEEMIGRPVEMFVPARLRQEDERARAVVRTRGVERLETRRLRKDGSEVDVLLTLSAIRNGSIAPVGVATVARDATELKLREAEGQKALRRLHAMTEIALSLGGETEIDRVLGVIARRGRALVDARTLVVLLDEAGELVVAASSGELEDDLDGARVEIGATPARAVLASGRPVRVSSSDGALVLSSARAELQAKAALFVPLAFRGRTYGVLAAADRLVRGPAFGDEDERLLRSYAATAATALATARSVQQERVRRSIQASESERSRIARDLHDEALQGLAALRVSLSWAFKHGNEDDLRDVVGGAVEQIAAEIAAIRSLIVELRPAVLDDLGLPAALEALAERHRSEGAPEIEMSIELGQASPTERLEPELESTVYRIVQEALNNVQKHADATRVRVEVGVSDGAVSVVVSDDGAGFDDQAAGEGFGIIGMLERVTLVGGQLEVGSLPGRGTTVRASMPLEGSPAIEADAPREEQLSRSA